MISFLKTHWPKFAPYLALALAVLAVKHWVLSRANIFLQDDYAILLKAVTVDPVKQFTLLAHSVYNDRPFGDFFQYLVAGSLHLNYVAAHALQLALHIVNVWLAFYVFRRLACNLWAALLAALTIGIWPWSTMAAQWTTAIYDMLAMFFTVAAAALYAYHLYDEKRVKFFTPALLLLIYMVAVRTKENTITLPLLLTLEAGYFTLVTRRTAELRRNLAALVPLFLYMTAVLFNHLHLVQFQSTLYTLKPTSIYYLSFKPESMINKFFDYLWLYFDKRSAAVALFMVFGALLIHPLRFITLLAMLVFSLLMILPMVNNKHQLYLYMPSLFIMLMAAAMLTPIFERLPRAWMRVGLFVLLAGALAARTERADRLQNEGFNRETWKRYAAKDRDQHAQFQKRVTCLDGTEKFLIHNAKQGSIFGVYGPGDSIRLYTGMKGLKFDYVKDAVTEPQKLATYDVVININGGKFIFEKMSKSKRKVNYLVKF